MACIPNLPGDCTVRFGKNPDMKTSFTDQLLLCARDLKKNPPKPYKLAEISNMTVSLKEFDPKELDKWLKKLGIHRTPYE